MAHRSEQASASSTLAVGRARRLAEDLVRWYLASARDLPWRRTRDPYAIWVSEVMLQQTRVEAVRERYAAFLHRFPTVSQLAAAPPADVLAAWAGLGYYRRARQLHAAAQRIAQQQGGRLPGTAAGLQLLPGFGAYTAGAVASIAYDEPVPAVDGNVERVFSRLLALEQDPTKGACAATVRAAASALLPHARPSLLNQALMELGALICTPRSPQCSACPWAAECAGRATGVPEVFPRRPPRRATLDVACYAAVLRDGDRLLFRRRPDGGHNAGLWELPTTDWHPGQPSLTQARRSLVLLGEGMSARWEVGDAIARARHSITHHRVTVVAHRAQGRVAPRGDLAWATPVEACRLGTTAAAGKLLRGLPTLL